MDIQAWGSECVRGMTSLTVLWGFLSMIVAYLVLALVDRWVLQRGRKGPVQWPILGATPEILQNYGFFNDWPVQYFLRDGLTFSCKMANLTYTFTADPANVEHILKTNFANYPKGKVFHENFDAFLGDGIFNVDGEIWKKQRKTASFEFASRKLREYSTVVFRDYSVKLASILTDASSQHQAMDMQDLFMRFTLDSIFKIAFGYEIGTLKPGLPDIPFAKAFEITNEVTSSRFMNPFWKLQRALKIGSEAVVIKSAKEVDDFTYSVIKARKAEMMSSTKGFGKGDLQSPGKGDLFTRFMVLNEEGNQQFTDKNFRDTLLNFLIAGRDTTAVTLSWFVYMMTLHPHVAQKILEELLNFEESENSVSRVDINSKESMGDEHFNRRILKFSGLFNFDSLLRLPYLHACILETLRLYPAVPMDPKSIVDDDILPDGTAVKKGGMIMYAPYSMGRMPSLWGPDATEFRPERWIVNGVVQPESPFKFTAFQAGPRICLGKDSAMLQLRMSLAILCRFFKFQLVPGSVVKYRQMSTLLLAHGLHVEITKRLD
ncbi:hypothetical protein M758_8G059500 [Ceratodon purpureus]|nr:hypothetical protein M758_8G059500 [Ceratodon purpureus]